MKACVMVRGVVLVARVPVRLRVYLPGLVSKLTPARANQVLVEALWLKVSWWPSQVPLRDASFTGAWTLKRTGAPLRSFGGWAWTVQGVAADA